MRWCRVTTLVVMAAAVLSGCGDGAARDVRVHGASGTAAHDRGDARGAGEVRGAVAAPGSERHDGAHAPSGAVGAAAVDPAEVRLTLEHLLGHHATLSIRMMRARVIREQDFVESILAALVGNSRDLRAAVQSIYGPDRADAFERVWVEHVRALFDYAGAATDGNQATKKDIRDRLDWYRAEFGRFVDGATGGVLPAPAVAETLRPHIDHLLTQVEAYAAGDYARAYALQREAYAHMFSTGKSLAGGFVQRPGELPVPVDGAPLQLRSALSMLLGEHVDLAVDAMRAGVRGRPEFPHAGAALNANTADVIAAMQTLFGPDRAREFSEIWGGHIDLLVQYTAALAKNDEPSKQSVRTRLSAYPPRLGAFLSAATGGRLPADVATRELQTHDDQLVRQIDAYAASQYQLAHTLAFDTYRHMFATAGALAAGIQGQLAGQVPAGGAQTGGGGTAGR